MTDTVDYEANIDWLLEFADLHDPVYCMHSTSSFLFDKTPLGAKLRDEAVAGNNPYRLAYATHNLWICMMANEKDFIFTLACFKKSARDWPIGLRKHRRDAKAKVDYLAITRELCGRS